jgi:DNA polymerase-3 subunit delta'
MAETEAGLAPDGLPGVPHPREQFSLVGHGEAEAAFLDGWREGRLHHAWLIGGPQGIGKATLAYRVARFLLAHKTPGAPVTGLDVSPDHPAARQVAAQSHPDLAIVRRGLRKDGKAYASEILVDHVRRALDLFGSTAGGGGYRVCIVDSADDLNANSANALLKLVEEPPPRSIFLIVSHAPQRVLPTIRSRCRRLQLRPLANSDVAHVVRSLGSPWAEWDAEPLERAIGLSEGSPRRTIEMLDEDKQALVAKVDGLLADLPRLDYKRVLTLAETLNRRDGADDYELALDTVSRWVSGELGAGAALGPSRLAPLVEVCEKVARAAREVDTYNLDRRPLVVTMFGDLAAAVRRAREAH